MCMVQLTIEGGTIVTMDRSRRIITDGTVVIDEGRIIDVGPGMKLRNATREIRSSTRIIRP